MQAGQTFPKVDIAGLEVSRLVCGTNSFLGYSHYTAARDAWLRRYFTVDRIVETLLEVWNQGINSIVGPCQERLAESLKAFTEQTGNRFIWIGTSLGSPDIEQQKRDLEFLAENGATFGMIHCGYTDTHLLSAERRVEGLAELLEYSRSLGLIPGVSTHRPETLPVCEAEGYDSEVYILPHNVLGFLSPVEIEWVANIIRQTAKPVINIKPLAAGKLTPVEGLTYVYNTIKENDVVCVGFMSPEEARDTATVARNILLGKGERREMVFTPSKSTVQIQGKDS